MAFADYCHCGECWKRLFYDGNGVCRDYMYDYETSDYIICSDCYRDLKNKIEKLIEKDAKINENN